jgi:hypothetical protein
MRFAIKPATFKLDYCFIGQAALFFLQLICLFSGLTDSFQKLDYYFISPAGASFFVNSQSIHQPDRFIQTKVSR